MTESTMLDVRVELTTLYYFILSHMCVRFYVTSVPSLRPSVKLSESRAIFMVELRVYIYADIATKIQLKKLE